MLPEVVNMKIGILHSAFQCYGGAEFVALVATNALASAGFDVELFVDHKVVQKELKKMMGETLEPSVRITAKPSFFALRGMWDIFQVANRSFVLKSRNDILFDTYSNAVLPWTDVCYVHFPFLNDESYRATFPYLKSHHLADVVGLPFVLFGREIQDYKNKLVLANSNFTANITRKFMAADVKVLYPPVPRTFFDDLTESPASASRENVVVTVSRFGVNKGLEKIPYIATLLGEDTKFVIIGLLQSSRVYEAVKQQIKRLDVSDRVLLLPNASRSEIKEVLKKAKIYLHTRIGEHFGISIVEAMAAGCVPIVPNSGGMGEFVPQEYRYQTIPEAAEKIRKGLADWTFTEAKVMRSIAEQFREENFCKNLLSMFENFVEDFKRVH